LSWGLVKLGDVAPSKPLKSPVVIDENNTWQLNLDMIESQTGRIIKKQKGKVSEAGTSTHWFDSRHVLYSKLRPYLNKVILPDEQGLASTELVPMFPDVDRLDRNYLMHYLRSNQFVNWITEQVAGAKMPRVSMTVFWGHKIPLPYVDDPAKSLLEQRRISAILDKADTIRHKRQQAIKLVDDFLRSVFLDMFGDPVSNPKNWKVKPLKEQILHANNGLSRRRKTEENIGDIVLRLQDVHYDGIRFEKELNRIQLDDKEKPRYLLESGDVLFVRVNGNPDYVGRSAVFKSFDAPVYHNDHIIRIKCGGDYNPEFLSYLFNLAGGRKIISGKIKTSAGQHTISQGGIESLCFYRPTKSLQDKFVTVLNAINLTSGKFNDFGKSAENNFNAISQKAFTGEL
jgi:type I restriction enzyme S subunit